MAAEEMKVGQHITNGQNQLALETFKRNATAILSVVLLAAVVAFVVFKFYQLLPRPLRQMLDRGILVLEWIWSHDFARNFFWSLLWSLVLVPRVENWWKSFTSDLSQATLTLTLPVDEVPAFYTALKSVLDEKHSGRYSLISATITNTASATTATSWGAHTSKRWTQSQPLLTTSG